MLPFPPAGRRMRTTVEYVWVENGAIRVLEYNRARLFALLYYDNTTSQFPSFGRTEQSVNVNPVFNVALGSPFVFYGIEELWMGPGGGFANGSTAALVHAVYED